jgi:two-component system aerobic respiration control sensor histidine kinase ArcB
MSSIKSINNYRPGKCLRLIHQKPSRLQSDENINCLDLKKVLIVEDQKMAQKVHAFYLEPYPLNLTFASNAKSALREINHAKASFDLILMDIGLPDLDGFTLSKKIREQGVEAPILVISANRIPKKKQELFSEYIQAFYVKPLMEKEYQKIIERFLMHT